MKKIPKIETAIFDIETNGLLHKLTKITCLVIADVERKKIYRFRNNKSENTIEIGLKILENGKTIVGHNILGFDLRAILKVYPDFKITAKIRDTLVMTRLIFSNQKQYDYNLKDKGILPGFLIGSHTLDSWGFRLGEHKGDYKKEREKEGKELGITCPEELSEFVWGQWNPELESYCVQDVKVNVKLWHKLIEQDFPEASVIFEHRIHDLMGEVQENGFPFDVAKAEKLADQLVEEMDALSAEAKQELGKWFAPAKKIVVSPLWDDPKGMNKAKSYVEPPCQHVMEERERKATIPLVYCEHTGEVLEYEDVIETVTVKKKKKVWEADYSRRIWGEATIPKRTMNPADPTKLGSVKRVPFTKLVLKEFNPMSRHHVIDRLTTVYKWEPTEFTDKGFPKVDDSVLRSLAEHIPIADKLAELFYLKKRLGQIRDGKEAWLKKVEEDGKIHSYTNTGGTVSGRCSHAWPNLGQVPRVVVLKYNKKTNQILKGDKVMDIPKQNFIIEGGKAIIKGRDGDHGWECRQLFHVPEPFVQVGCDLSGIEARMLAEFCYAYDRGQLMELILHGDIHQYNVEAADLPSRDHAKTILYALIYGAGDRKLGLIIDPFLPEGKQISLGRQIRAKLMRGLPGLRKLNEEVQREAGKKWITGLDGRRIAIRNKYSALNTKLQSAAALIAKKWVLLTRDYLEDKGLSHGWEHEFALLAFVHDELQTGVLKEHSKLYQKLVMRAAKDAGEYFEIGIPVDSECKVGHNWAETH